MSLIQEWKDNWQKNVSSDESLRQALDELKADADKIANTAPVKAVRQLRIAERVSEALTTRREDAVAARKHRAKTARLLQQAKRRAWIEEKKEMEEEMMREEIRRSQVSTPWLQAKQVGEGLFLERMTVAEETLQAKFEAVIARIIGQQPLPRYFAEATDMSIMRAYYGKKQSIVLFGRKGVEDDEKRMEEAWTRFVAGKDVDVEEGVTGDELLARETKANYVKPNLDATGMVATGEVVDHDLDKESTALAVQTKDSWVGRQWGNLKEDLSETRLGAAAVRMKEKFDASDSELAVRTREASGEMQEVLEKLRQRALPETETALALGAVRMQMPDFSLEDFIQDLQKKFVPKLMKAYAANDMDTLRLMVGDGLFTQLSAAEKMRQQQGLRLCAEVIAVKTIDLHEAILDGQEPRLRFLFSVHQTQFVLDANEDVVEGMEDEVLNITYDLTLKQNEDGPTDDLPMGFRVVGFQPVGSYAMW